MFLAKVYCVFVEGTITVPIMGANRTMSENGWYGDGLREVAVNRQSHFHLPAPSINESELTVRVTCKHDTCFTFTM